MQGEIVESNACTTSTARDVDGVFTPVATPMTSYRALKQQVALTFVFLLICAQSAAVLQHVALHAQSSLACLLSSDMLL